MKPSFQCRIQLLAALVQSVPVAHKPIDVLNIYCASLNCYISNLLRHLHGSSRRRQIQIEIETHIILRTFIMHCLICTFPTSIYIYMTPIVTNFPLKNIHIVLVQSWLASFHASPIRCCFSWPKTHVRGLRPMILISVPLFFWCYINKHSCPYVSNFSKFQRH